MHKAFDIVKFVKSQVKLYHDININNYFYDSNA